MKTKLLLTALLIILINCLTAQVINVPGDFSTIQAGINAASAGEMVIVDDGIYIENINFDGKAITVASNFILDGDTTHISNTIINGSQPAHPDSASVVSFVSGEDTTSVLMGFTITGGNGTCFETAVLNQGGGGIFCYYSGAKIMNNYIINDSIITDLQGVGAGIYAGPKESNSYIVIKNNKIYENYILSTSQYFAASPAISTDCNCDIIGNEIINNTCISENFRASGAVCCRGIDVPKYCNISDNIISYNKTSSYATAQSAVFAGALYIVYNYGRVHNNIIMHNELSATGSPGECYGAGITALFTDTALTIENNIIAYNKSINSTASWGGGIFMLNSTAKIVNNLIYKNEATVGGGIAIQDSDTDNNILINNTIVYNMADYGGGIHAINDSAIVLNTIVYDNTATYWGQQIHDENNSMTISYSNIENPTPWQGEGNINQDPVFIDPANDDYHLTDESPCTNAAIDILSINGKDFCCPDFDYEGDLRPLPFYAMPDIGADEVNETTNIQYQEIPNSNLYLSNFPNPVKNSTTIEFSIPQISLVKLSIIDFTGKEIQTLVSEYLSDGTHKFVWSAEGLPAGIYFLRMETNGISETRKIVLLK